MKIKLIFRGQLSAGISQAQAIEGVAALVKQAPHVVERRLFTGQAVTVKTVESQADAGRFVAAFAKAGIVLDIQNESAGGEPATRSEESAAPVVESGSRVVEPAPKSALRVAGIVSAAVAIVVVAGAAWYLQPVWRAGGTSEAVKVAARALATDDLVALGHVDVKRAVELQERLFGERDPGALISADEDTWDSLASAGVDIGEHISDVLMALHVEDDRVDWSVIGLGPVNAASIRQWISAQYEVERFDAGTGTVYFTWVDEDTCEPAELRAARIGQTRVLVTTADRIEVMWALLEQDTPAAAPIIDHWLSASDEQFMTFGVFNTESIGKAADGMAGSVLTAAGQAAAPADGLYLGVAPTLIPPGVNLVGTIASSDRAFLDQAHGAASQWLESAKTSAQETSPDLLAMYDRISVSLDGPNFRAGVRLDTDIDNELQKLISALFRQSFQTTMQGVGESTEIEERLAESPQQFGNASAEQLQPFSQFGNSFFEPQWQQGPFAVAVSKLAVDEQGKLLVSLRGEGRGLPNLGERSGLVRFRVTDAVDENGASVLPNLGCGPIRNTEWEEDNRVSQASQFQGRDIVYFPAVALEKHLQLADSVDAGAVAAVRGEIEFFLPTQVRSIRVDSPSAGSLIEESGVRLSFKAGSDSTISYQVSGDTRRLLAVRGLNERGQILESGSSSWGDVWFGSGKNVSLDFYGKVAAAEVVLAEEFDPVSYSFELPGAYPTIDSSRAMPLPPMRVAQSNSLTTAMQSSPPKVAFEYMQPLATTSAGPALLALGRMQASSFMGLTAQFDLYVSSEFPLENQLNGASVVLSQAVFADGSTQNLDISALANLRADGGYWLNGEFQYDETKPWLKGGASLQAEEYDAETPVTVNGHVVFREIRNTAFIVVPAEPGSRIDRYGVDVMVSEWRENTIFADVHAGADRIVWVTAVDGDGNPVGRADTMSGSGDSGRFSVDLNAVPAAIEVIVALDPEEFVKPFSLSLDRQ